MRACVLDEFAKSLHHCGPLEELAKEVNPAPQFFMRNRFEETFRRHPRGPVEFARLRGSRARHLQSFTFSGHLANQPRSHGS